METLEFEALSIVRIVLTTGMFVGAIWLGIKAGERWNKWAGWAAFIATFVAFTAFFFPVVNLLQDRMCEMRPLMEDCY